MIRGGHARSRLAVIWYTNDTPALQCCGCSGGLKRYRVQSRSQYTTVPKSQYYYVYNTESRSFHHRTAPKYCQQSAEWNRTLLLLL